MKIVFISIEGDGLALALRLAQAHHEVYVTLARPFPGSEYLYRNVRVRFDGKEYFNLVPKSHIGAIIERSPIPLVIFDGNKEGAWADRLRNGRKKIPVWNGGQLADKLEYDRDFGLKVMKDCGIEVPESVKFTDYPKAIEYAKKNEKRWVIKVSGDGLPSSATRVSDSPENAVDILRQMEKEFAGKPFELQEYKEGVNVEIEGWFNGDEFVLPMNLTFEKKKRFTGDLGHNLGCATNVVCGVDPSAPVTKLLMGMRPFLEKNRFIGNLSLNLIVSEGKPYGLEFTSRFGFDATFTLLDGVYGDIGELMGEYAMGRSARMPMSLEDRMVGVNFRYESVEYANDKVQAWKTADGVVHHSLYPRGLAIGGVNRSNVRHLWFYDMMASKSGRPLTAGSHGTLGVAVYTDRSINVAAERVYELLKGIEVDGMEYRVDAGNGVEDKMKTLGSFIEPTDAKKEPPPDNQVMNTEVKTEPIIISLKG